MAREMKDSGIEWIGEIPAEWESKKLKYIVTYNDETLEESTDDEYEFDYIDIGSVQYGKGIVQLQRMTFKDAPSRARRIVKENDVIVSTVRTYLKAVTMINASTIPLVASTGFIVLRAKQNEILSSFLNYAVLSDAFISMIEARSFGISYPAINATSVVDISIPLPQIEEQKSISEFLNTECSRIDSAIEQTRASIEEYKKLKQAVITQAVTKGIRPGRQMKDSGVEWIGQIPNNWKVHSLGTVTESMRNGYVGPTKDLFYDEGIRYIQSLHIKDGRIDFSRHEYYVSEEWANMHPKIKENDVLIVQTGDIGNVGLVTKDYDGCNCHALIIATPKTDMINPEFLTYYLRSTIGKELLLYHKTGALLPHLNSGKIKFTDICVPDLMEQQEIVQFLDKEVTKIDNLITKKETLLTNLESYKKSLIYEYVTGKKEVPA